MELGLSQTRIAFCTSLLSNLVSVFNQTASWVDISAKAFLNVSDFRGSTLCALCRRISVDVSYSCRIICENTSAYVQTRHLASVSDMIFGSCHLILFVSFTNYFQIVRRQCSLHKLVDVVMSFCTDKRYISTCVLRLSRQLPPTLISTTFNTYNWI